MVGLMVRYYPCQNRVNYSPKTKCLMIILNYIFYMLHFQWNMISLPSFKNNISATFITGFIGIFFWVVIIKSPNQTNQPPLDNHQSSSKQNFLIAVNGATFKELLKNYYQFQFQFERHSLPVLNPEDHSLYYISTSKQSCNEKSSKILGEGRWYSIHDFLATFGVNDRPI